MAGAIMVKHFKHSSCFHMRFNINKKTNKPIVKPIVKAITTFISLWVIPRKSRSKDPLPNSSPARETGAVKQAPRQPHSAAAPGERTREPRAVRRGRWCLKDPPNKRVKGHYGGPRLSYDRDKEMALQYTATPSKKLHYTRVLTFSSRTVHPQSLKTQKKW